jgi:hypothetical protein
VGVVAAAAGVLAVSEDGLAVATGVAAFAIVVSAADGLTVAAGAVAAAARVAESLRRWADSRVG